MMPPQLSDNRGGCPKCWGSVRLNQRGFLMRHEIPSAATGEMVVCEGSYMLPDKSPERRGEAVDPSAPQSALGQTRDIVKCPESGSEAVVKVSHPNGGFVYICPHEWCKRCQAARASVHFALQRQKRREKARRHRERKRARR